LGKRVRIFLPLAALQMDDAAFLQVICADPDADGPRLRYADYLDEKGDPASVARAEFIRVQCALAAAEPTDPVVSNLGLRERALLGANWRDWLKPACQALAEPTPVTTGTSDRYALNWVTYTERLAAIHWVAQTPSASPPYLHSGQFRRGFLSHVALMSKPHKSASHVARLFERAPVDGITFVDRGGAEADQTLRAIPAGRLRVLELVACPTETVLAVVRSDKLKGLRDLVVMGTVGPDIGDEIGRSSAFPSLRTLVLHRCGLDAAGVAQICRAGYAAGLERLELTGCQMPAAALATLAQNYPNGTRLHYLGLTRDSDNQRVLGRLKARFGDVCDFTEDDREWPSRYFRWR
jgi:uncharacterized protein (TIGR02996 family)